MVTERVASGGRGGRVGRHGLYRRKCEVGWPETTNLTVLANRSDGPALVPGEPACERAGPRASGAAVRRQPDVGEGRDDRHDADGDDRQQREQRVTDETRALARSCVGRHPAAGLGEAASALAANESQREEGCDDGAIAASVRLSRRRRRRRPSRPASPRRPKPADHADRGDHRPPALAPGEHAHRLVGLERGQDQRPAEAGRHARLDRRRRGSGRRARWRVRSTTPARSSRRTGAVGAVPAGTRSATSAAVPTDSRGTTDQAGVERCVVDRDGVEPLADLEVDPLAAVLERHPAAIGPQLETGPAEDERAMGVVLELVLGVDPAADPDVASGPGRRARAPRAIVTAPRRRQQPPDPIPRPVGAQDEDTGDERDETGDEGDQGRHGGDDTRRT